MITFKLQNYRFSLAVKYYLISGENLLCCLVKTDVITCLHGIVGLQNLLILINPMVIVKESFDLY